ncbi:MAG: hypothetical protein LT102_15870 [Burkholderiaceae bacterium]|nr:hypothetical protein [Burkholderiaceae bacterium]
MTSKRKADKTTKASSNAGTVILPEQPGKTRERIFAEVAAAGTLDNAHLMQTFAQPTMGELQLTECVHALRDKTRAVNRGDLTSVEAMLIEQATALSAIFAELSRRSARNMGEYLDAADRYMRLALKAQSQCRATLETLATVKAGPVIVARQANIAHGPQQVNNGIPAPIRADARAGETESAKTELLTSRASSGAHSDAWRSDLSGAPLAPTKTNKENRG